MFHRHPAVLTSSDLARLEALLEQLGPRRELLAIMLAQKLESARVVATSEIPRDVATLNSRVRYRVGHGPSDERQLVWRPEQDRSAATLPASVPRGLALIGMRAGQKAAVPRLDGRVEHLTLESVLWQPESPPEADPKEPRGDDPTSAERCGLITSLAALRARRAMTWGSSGGTDEPGPTAA